MKTQRAEVGLDREASGDVERAKRGASTIAPVRESCDLSLHRALYLTAKTLATDDRPTPDSDANRLEALGGQCVRAECGVRTLPIVRRCA